MTKPFAVPQKSGQHAKWIHGEPAIDDLLHDPLVKLVLGRDGLTADDLRHAIAVARARLIPPAMKSSRAA